MKQITVSMPMYFTREDHPFNCIVKLKRCAVQKYLRAWIKEFSSTDIGTISLPFYADELLNPYLYRQNFNIGSRDSESAFACIDNFACYIRRYSINMFLKHLR